MHYRDTLQSAVHSLTPSGQVLSVLFPLYLEVKVRLSLCLTDTKP
jgi:hypothetical protein